MMIREWCSQGVGLQAVLLSALLLLGGGAKVLGRRNVVAIERTVFALLARSRVSLLALWTGLGVLELAIGLAVLLLPAAVWPAGAAAALFLASTGYLAWSRHRGTGRPCGCMGTRSTGPVTYRTVVRTLLLALAAMALAVHPVAWYAIRPGLPAVLWFVAEAVLLGWLFPELWRRASPGGETQVDCVTGPGLPPEQALEQLQRSPIWQKGLPYLVEQDVVHREAPQYIEQWREGCHRFFTYQAELAGAPVTAVFSVVLDPRSPDCRLALVDEVRGEVLLQVASG